MRDQIDDHWFTPIITSCPQLRSSISVLSVLPCPQLCTAAAAVWNFLAHSSWVASVAGGACRAAGVAPALLGSLVLVALLREAAEGTEKPAYIIGFNLADFMKEGFIAIAAPLGALGSFFSGSTTVSNLTFGIVHQVRPDTCTCMHEYLHVCMHAHSAGVAWRNCADTNHRVVRREEAGCVVVLPVERPCLGVVA